MNLRNLNFQFEAKIEKICFAKAKIFYDNFMIAKMYYVLLIYVSSHRFVRSLPEGERKKPERQLTTDEVSC